MEAIESFPERADRVETQKGKAILVKTDIFKGQLWYSYENNGMNWHQLSLEKVNEIIEINKKGEKVPSLEDFIEEVIVPDKELFSNVVGQDSLTRFDKPKPSRNKRRKPTQNKTQNKDQNTGQIKTQSKNQNKNRKPQNNAK